MSREKNYILSIDQGTTGTRAAVVDREGRIMATYGKEHRQIFPRSGWVEHDAVEIWKNTRSVVAEALAEAGVNRHSLAAVGVTNQRETVVVWDPETGEPVAPAIVWQDTRTQALCDELAKEGGEELFRRRTGLPLATYFAGPKIAWILDNVPGVRERAENGELVAGTIDTWLVWNLTGGVNGGVHVTDVSNASRTLLMNIDSLEWDAELAERMGVPLSMLPEIRSSSEVYGVGDEDSLLIGTPIAGILGDQQAATFGQACFDVGQAKTTYGTGTFMLLNTGSKAVRSDNGLITTLAYKLGDADPVYALEGSVAVTGSLVQWIRDNLGFISTAAEVETLAVTVDNNGGCYIVPAFSGLYAPHWRPDARGAIVGLTRYVTKAHIARAVLEAASFQTRDIADAMQRDAADHHITMTDFKVDGGMSANSLLMQHQADMLNLSVVIPESLESTALGAAFAAGLAVGFWSGTDELKGLWREGRRFEPRMDTETREREARLWAKAVERTLDWVDEDVKAALG